MHSTKCKWWYAIWTLPMIAYYKVCGVSFHGISFFGGFSYISHYRGSVIDIGKRCRFMSKQIGNLLGINHRCILATYNANAILKIGDGCSFSGVSIWCFDHIVIGNHVRVGANCIIMDGDAHQDDLRAGQNSPIVIEDNVWLGANVIVLKGVTIGHNSLIGAGSIVTHNIPENVVAAGNPCRIIKEIK